MENNARWPRYRAWHKATSTMYQVVDIEWNSLYQVTAVRCAGVQDYYPSREVVLMEYLERNDKAGRKLCEGDVVGLSVWIGAELQDWVRKSFTTVIVWSVNVLGFVFREVGDCKPLVFSLFNNRVEEDEIELLGNSYENPELVK